MNSEEKRRKKYFSHGVNCGYSTLVPHDIFLHTSNFWLTSEVETTKQVQNPEETVSIRKEIKKNNWALQPWYGNKSRKRKTEF